MLRRNCICKGKQIYSKDFFYGLDMPEEFLLAGSAS